MIKPRKRAQVDQSARKSDSIIAVNSDYSALDCQGFAGGLTLGMVQAGWQLAGKRENIGGFGVTGCEVNRHLLGNDWYAQVSEPQAWDPLSVRMVFGNPPCSGFSTLGVGQGKEGNKYGIGSEALINECMRDLVRFASRCEPEVVVLESVDRMFTRGRTLATELRNMLIARTRVSWTLHHVRHDVGRLGASQKSRRRYFWVATAPGVILTIPDLPSGAKATTSWDALADLSGLDWTVPGEQAYLYGSTPWSEPLRRSDGLVDGHVTASPLTNAKVIEFTAKYGWPPGDSLVHVLARLDDDVLENLPTGGGVHSHHKDRARRFNSGAGNTMTSFQLWRLNPRTPAKTVDGATPKSIIHPVEDRLLTMRETYRLLGYPDEWRLGERAVYKQANWPGKGVSPIAGRWIGEAIKDSVDGKLTRNDASPPERIGDDEWLWDRR